MFDLKKTEQLFLMQTFFIHPYNLMKIVVQDMSWQIL